MRVAGFIVTLKEDMHSEDAVQLAAAIALLCGVVSVAPVEPNANDHINRERIRRELATKLYDVLREA